jgi:hypothetical protein
MDLSYDKQQKNEVRLLIGFTWLTVRFSFALV